MTYARTNYDLYGRPISITYTEAYSGTSVTVPLGCPNPFSGPSHAYAEEDHYSTFPQIHRPRNEDERASRATHRHVFPEAYSYTTYTYGETSRPSSSSSEYSESQSHTYSRTYTSSSPPPPPRSPPPRRSSPIAFYTYEDEEPDTIPVAPAKWNNFRTEATKEELVNFFVWRGMERARAEREVGREFESHAPRWMGDGHGGTKLNSRAEERDYWKRGQ